MHANSNIRFAINRRIKPDAYRSIFTIIFTFSQKKMKDAAFYHFYPDRQRKYSEKMKILVVKMRKRDKAQQNIALVIP